MFLCFLKIVPTIHNRLDHFYTLTVQLKEENLNKINYKMLLSLFYSLKNCALSRALYLLKHGKVFEWNFTHLMAYMIT